MTATTERSNAQLFADARRARVLRWLLKLRKAHDLLMPQRIEFQEFSSPVSGTLRCCLNLTLDDDADVTGWATAIGAVRREEFLVDCGTHTFTCVRAVTDWRPDGPRVDWHQITVTSYHNYQYRSLTGDPAVRS